MTTRKYFGTDGVRGRVGDEVINPQFVMKLGWAVGHVLANGHKGKVLIGKDTRVSGYMLESALEAGLAAAGMDIHLLGPMPTPAIAYLTNTLRAKVGIVISASHNLYEDNGIKFFAADGTKLADEIEAQIEAQMDMPFTVVDSAELGKAHRVDDAPGRYIEFCKSTIPSRTRLTGMHIVVDCAHGATYHIASSVFEELGAKVTVLGVSPDGFNINAEGGSTKPQQLQQAVLESGADVGVGLDGDGDRVVMVDARGELLDGDDILYLICKDRLQYEAVPGVVGTVMTNLGLEVALNGMSVDFVRSAVGDRYVLAELHKRSWNLGGEASGHIICLDKTTTGDGIVAGLQVLLAMQHSGQALHELRQGLQKFPQTIINVPTLDPASLVQDPRIQAGVEAVKSQLKDKGRVLIRPSGTEPVVRIMVESEDETQTRQLAEQLAAIMNQGLGQ